MSYLETLRHANVHNPFEAGSVKNVISVAKDELFASKYMQEN